MLLPGVLFSLLLLIYSSITPHLLLNSAALLKNCEPVVSLRIAQSAIAVYDPHVFEMSKPGVVL